MTDVSRFLDKAVKAPKADVPARTGWLGRLFAQEDLNFLLTNRIPRHASTLAMGRISRIRSRAFTRVAIWVWRRFTDLDLSEAAHTNFHSIHECFTRELKPGARPVEQCPEVLCSPCDAIVGAHGKITAGMVLQAKGMPYTLRELVGPNVDLKPFESGHFMTLRLTSSMYHRFHAPEDLELRHVTYISGDTWNVNPIALRRVERLFCRNERAVLQATLSDGTPILIIPVAAILVASMRLHAMDVLLHIRYKGPHEIPVQARYARGQEMGWFEHGSTIIVLTPAGVESRPDLEWGQHVRMGQALWHRLTDGQQSCRYAIQTLFHRCGALKYGEDVSQLEHALQCAQRAQDSGAAPSLIVAALLHDIGHMLHHDAAAALVDAQDDAHEVLGAAALVQWFGPEVSEPVRLHVQAKRYLCSRRQGYFERLSPLSQRTLQLQGGMMSDDEATRFESLPYAQEAVQLRQWDDEGKLAECQTPSLAHFLNVARGLVRT